MGRFICALHSLGRHFIQDALMRGKDGKTSIAMWTDDSSKRQESQERGDLLTRMGALNFDLLFSQHQRHHSKVSFKHLISAFMNTPVMLICLKSIELQWKSLTY